ncbi:hypothetical protein ACFE04_017434 [Oxalis oulophora]
MLAAGEYTNGQIRQPEEISLAEPNTPRVITILSSVIEKLVARNDQLVDGFSRQPEGSVVGKSFNGFHGVRAPNISIPKYLERIYKYTNCSPSCFVVGYVYIDRLLHKHPDSLVISLNVHRLLVTSVMVASKMIDDDHYNNAFYARVGGVTNTELNRLELELLFLLDYGVMVSSRVFESYCAHLEKQHSVDGIAHHKIERPILPIQDEDGTVLSVEDYTQSTSSTPVD